MQCRQPGGVRPGIATVVDLRSKDDALAALASLREPSTEDRLCLTAAVDVCSVEEVDSLFECAIHDREGFGLVGAWTEVHGAKANRAHAETRTTQKSILHRAL